MTVYVVTVVDYIGTDACDPVVFIFDNPLSADACLRYLSSDTNKVYLTKEEVWGSFMVAGKP